MLALDAQVATPGGSVQTCRASNIQALNVGLKGCQLRLGSFLSVVTPAVAFPAFISLSFCPWPHVCRMKT